MTRFAIVATLTFFIAAPPARGADVVLAKGKSTVKATIGGEGFLAYQIDVGRKKPFFLPVAAPGGFELLKKVVEGSIPKATDLPYDSVFVIQEGAALRESPSAKTSSGTVKFGDILTASKVEAPWVYVDDKKGWLNFADVVPIASTITRLINDENPPPKVDKNDARYYDHPHHKGIWFSIDEVNGLKHWAEGSKIINKSVEIITPKGETAVMKVVNEWVDSKDAPVLEETTIVRIHSSRLIDYDATLKAVSGPVKFEHTKEGMFAVRVPNAMREQVAKGPVVSDAGVTGTKELWGKPTPWIDYQGPLNGQKFGVAVLDHPGNFRPSRYHVRDYGLFAISPFGDPDYTGGKVQTPPHELKQGESVTLRYAAYPHQGDEKSADVAGAYQQFTSPPAPQAEQADASAGSCGPSCAAPGSCCASCCSAQNYACPSRRDLRRAARCACR